MRRLRIGTFLVIVVVSLFIYFTVDLSSATEDWLHWVKEHKAIGVLTFVGIFILACLLMIPGTPLMLGAGFALGVFWGQVAVSIGATVGAQAAYYVGQDLLRSYVQEDVLLHFHAFENIDKIMSQKEHSFEVCLLVRMCPVLPYNILNYAL